MEALGVAATADALIREGRPEFKGEDGKVKIWTPHRPPRIERRNVPVRYAAAERHDAALDAFRPRLSRQGISL
jgi:excinuclease ABC subunit B